MNTINLDNKISDYQDSLNIIDNPDFYDTDAMRALVYRDVLADRWTELIDDQKHKVLKLDDILAQNWEIIATILPLRSSTPENRAQGRWWLFLDEGPQVRETIGKV